MTLTPTSPRAPSRAPRARPWVAWVRALVGFSRRANDSYTNVASRAVSRAKGEAVLAVGAGL